jgi:hemolysin III
MIAMPQVPSADWSSPARPEAAADVSHLVDEVEARALRAAEEVLNALTHGLGLLVIVALSPFLAAAAPAGAPRTSAVVYIVTMILLFGASTLYHAVEETHFGQRHARRWSSRFQTLDHIAIYLFIAGSYTPFVAVTLSGSSWQWPTLVTVWSIAGAGVLFKLFGGTRLRGVSVVSYLALGWTALVILPELARELSRLDLVLLAGGGVFYTAGVYFWWRDHRRYHHAIWHLFVLTGAGCHLAAIAHVLQAAPG